MSSHLCKPLTSYSCLPKKKPKVRGDITVEALSEMCFRELTAKKRICLQSIYTHNLYLLLDNKLWGTNYSLLGFGFFFNTQQIQRGLTTLWKQTSFLTPARTACTLYILPCTPWDWFSRGWNWHKKELKSFPSQPENQTGESKRLFNNRSFVSQ